MHVFSQKLRLAEAQQQAVANLKLIFMPDVDR